MRPASLGDTVRNFPQYVLPQRWLTAAAYRLTRVRVGWFKNAMIRAFVAHFGVNLTEAQQTDATGYADFNAFFTRPLRGDARPITAREDGLCCPVDGAVSQIGAIDADRIYQAKGLDYSLTDLLGGEEHVESFIGGSFATLYLSPRDYHRIHMPVAGKLTKMTHVPGKLFSVSPLTTRVVPRLFARNERLINLFDTEFGMFALIMVGACNVGSMTTVWAGQVTPPYGVGRAPSPTSSLFPSVELDQGEEMGRFNMGSTVILLFGPGAVRWADGLAAESGVKMGQLLAHPCAE